MKKGLFVLGFACLTVLSAGAGTLSAKEAGVDYSLYAEVLKEYVNEEGLVDYKGLKKNREKFDSFLEQIEEFDVSVLSETEEKAFWINAYNAVTLKVILDNYPVRDIRSVNFGLVWKLPRDVAGGRYSLGHIEHKILRPTGDPRIHFAINCASIGCPVLPRKPFYPETLDQQLDKAARDFINNPEKVRLDREKNVLHYSAIFDWFEEDYLEVADSIKDYILKYINEDDKTYIQNHDVKMKTLNYDWSLNEQ